MENFDLECDGKDNLCESLKKLFVETENIIDNNLLIEDEKDFEITDILTPIFLNNIKNDPKYCFQKFKILFVKFFTLEDYFFKMEKNKEVKTLLKKEEDKKKIFFLSNQSNKLIERKDKKKDKIINKSINKGGFIGENKMNRSHSNKIKKSIKLKYNNLIGKVNMNKNLNYSSGKIDNNSIHTKINNSLSEKSNSNIIIINDSFFNKSENKIIVSQLNSSGTIKSGSFSFEQKQGLKGLGIKIKDEIKEFPDYKLKLIKSNLNLEENDEMSGKAYEEYARKILKIMFLLVIKQEISFDNPDKISYSKIIDFYLENFFQESLDIKTPIKNSLYDDIHEGNELDIVYHMKYKELYQIAKKFNKYFLLNKIKSSDKVIDVQENDEITFIAEIAKNIVKQAKEKLSQILKYIKIFSIMNTIKTSSLADDDYYIKICDEYKCKPKTEKIFCIITDGVYTKLTNIINFITPLINESFTHDEIKVKIEEYVKSNAEILADESNIESFKENIFDTYLIFANLKKNKIKHALIYIGDLTNINYEEIFKNILGKDIKLNDSKKRIDITKMKHEYNQLKIIIKNFEKNLSNLTVVYSKDMKPIFLEIKKTIKELFKNPDNLIKKIYNNIKFDAFLFYQKNSKENFALIREKIEKSPAMKKLSKFFNLKITELEQNKTLSLMDNVRRCPEQFGKKIIFLVTEVNFFDKFLRNKFIYFPSIIKLIFYSIKQKKEINPQSTQVEEKIKVGFDFPDDFMDNLNIKSNVNMVFEKELKTIKKYFENETILKKENLKKKNNI